MSPGDGDERRGAPFSWTDFFGLECCQCQVDKFCGMSDRTDRAGNSKPETSAADKWTNPQILMKPPSLAVILISCNFEIVLKPYYPMTRWKDFPICCTILSNLPGIVASDQWQVTNEGCWPVVRHAKIQKCLVAAFVWCFSSSQNSPWHNVDLTKTRLVCFFTTREISNSGSRFIEQRFTLSFEPGLWEAHM